MDPREVATGSIAGAGDSEPGDSTEAGDTARREPDPSGIVTSGTTQIEPGVSDATGAPPTPDGGASTHDDVEAG